MDPSLRWGDGDKKVGEPNAFVRYPPMQTALKRTAEMAAVFMIGDGLLGLLQPTRHVDLWRSKVTAVDILIRPFKDRPARRRAYGALQLTAGILLASRLVRRAD